MNFGIIGLGNIANKFAKTLNLMNENLYAVASRDINKAKEFKDKYNATKYYGSYDELLNDSNVDIIYIATPNNMHFENAYSALIHNKNVICEKPFTTNPDEAIKLYSKAKELNLFIMEALWIRFLPMYKKLNELLNNNIIGNIKEITVSYGFDTNEERKKRKFNSDLAGGALLDIGIYNIGFLDMIMGSPKSFKSEIKLNEYNTDYYDKIYFSYNNGALATSISTIGTELKREAIIIGDKGKIYIPDFQQAQSFIVNKNNKEEEYSFPFEINGFEYQIREALDSIKNKKYESSIYSHNKSVELMKLLYDIRLSQNMRFNYEK